MATSTTNLGLIKPAGTDKIRIAQINSNMDVIDTKMGAVGNTPLQTQINNNKVHHRTTGTYSNNVCRGVTGFISGNGTTATIYIPVILSENITSVSVTYLEAYLRTVEGGYLGGTRGLDLTSYITETVLAQWQGGISLTLTNPSTWNLSNNTPIVGNVRATIEYTAS